MDLAQKPVYKLDLAAGTSVVNLTTPLVEGDDRAQTFTLELTDKGTPANLDGYSVTAYFGRGKTAEAEADTIPLSGTVSGNVATITLTESCYSRSCYFSMPIRLSNGATGQKRTYLIVRGTVVKSVDGTIIDPDGSVPSLDDLFAQIAVMERSRQAAEEATEEALAAAARADEAREGIQGDLATLSEDMALNTAPPIVPTATGSIVTIADGAARPSVEVISHIEPVQEGSGDASPDNVRPISGWNTAKAQRTGKNILPGGGDEQTGSFLLYATDQAFEGAKGQKINVSFDLYSPDGSAVSVYAYQQSGLSISNGYDFMPAAGVYARYSFNTSIFKYGQTLNAGNIIFYSPSGAAVKVKNVQIEFGTIATVYEPYQGKSLSASLYETVYGGKLDWTKGALTYDFDYVDLGGFVWVPDSNLGIFRTEAYLQDSYVNTTVLCTHYQSYGLDLRDVINHNNSICVIGGYIWVHDDRYTDAAEFQAALTGVKMLARLVTPRESQLTPQQLDTLKGTNNVWSDCGDTTLSYVADTELWATQKFAAIAAAMLAN